jgi:hypothetical protein
MLNERVSLPVGVTPESLVEEHFPQNPDAIQALEDFDNLSPGWLPRWFPSERSDKLLSQEERVQFFEEALEARLLKPWNPSATPMQQKLRLMESLLLIWSEVKNESGTLTLD